MHFLKNRDAVNFWTVSPNAHILYHLLAACEDSLCKFG